MAKKRKDNGYASKGGSVLYSGAYYAWKKTPNQFTAASHRKYVLDNYGPLARSRPVSYREEEVNHEFAEAAE